MDKFWADEVVNVPDDTFSVFPLPTVISDVEIVVPSIVPLSISTFVIFSLLKLIAPAAVKAPILVAVKVSPEKLMSLSTLKTPFVPVKTTLPLVRLSAVSVLALKSNAPISTFEFAPSTMDKFWSDEVVKLPPVILNEAPGPIVISVPSMVPLSIFTFVIFSLLKLIAPAAVKAPILVAVNVSPEKLKSLSSDKTPFVPAKTILPLVKLSAVTVLARISKSPISMFELVPSTMFKFWLGDVVSDPPAILNVEPAPIVISVPSIVPLLISTFVSIWLLKSIAPTDVKAPILVAVNVSPEKVRSLSSDKRPLAPEKTILPDVKVLTVVFPVISTPVSVTLNLSVLLIHVFISFSVENVIYSWSMAVPIFEKLGLTILSLSCSVISPDKPLPAIPAVLVILVTPPIENCENVKSVVFKLITPDVVWMKFLLPFVVPLSIYINDPCDASLFESKSVALDQSPAAQI